MRQKIRVLVFFTDIVAGPNIAASLAKCDCNNVLHVEQFYYFSGNAQQLSLCMLQKYHVILFDSIHYGLCDDVLVGDLFADFVDSNGGLVLCMFSNYQHSDSMSKQAITGRFKEENYHPLTYGDYICPNHAKLEHVSVSYNHALLRHVTRFEKHTSSVLVAQWDSDYPLLAYKKMHGTVVALNTFAVNQDAIAFCWPPNTSDGHQLLYNAVIFAANFNYFATSQHSVTASFCDIIVQFS